MILPRLCTLMAAYQADIDHAIHLLRQAVIAEPLESGLRRLPQAGFLPCGAEYFRHGIGVAVTWPLGSVDFDFGVAVGEDSGQLLRYARDKLDRFGYSSSAELAAELSCARLTSLAAQPENFPPPPCRNRSPPFDV